MANLCINLFITSPTFGLGGALDTLASQAYGRRDHRAIGNALNRARVTAVGYFIIAAVMFLFIEEILEALGQAPSVAQIAESYALLMLPGQFAQMQFDCTRRYCNAQKRFLVGMLV